MNNQFETTGYPYAVSDLQVKNRVLRNTYWLLALTMVPTVLGAWIGVESGITQRMGFMGSLLFLAIAFGGIFAIEKTKESITGVYVLLGFTFFMGLMLSSLIGTVLGFKNGGELVMTAFAGTAGVFFAMASLSTIIKRDLSSLGKWLFVGVITFSLVQPLSCWSSPLPQLVFSAPTCSTTSSKLWTAVRQITYQPL